MDSVGTMSRPDIGAEQHIYQQSDVSQRWPAAVTTLTLMVIACYGWPYLAYETTIKRRLYDLGASIVPTRFLNILQKSAARVVGLPDPFASKIALGQGPQTREGPGASLIVQKARTFSGLDRIASNTIQRTFTGLGNWDNSCFQNSVLQGLASLQAFKVFIEKSERMCTGAGIDVPTHEGLEVFISQLREEITSRKTMWPPSILRSMNTWQQQDAQEYFSKIMEAIEKEASRYQSAITKSLAPSLNCIREDNTEESASMGATNYDVHQLIASLLPPNPLGGSVSQTLRCQSCGHSEGLSLMPFNCLTLNLGLGGNCNLEDLFEEYIAPELIEGVECDECTRLANEEPLQQATAPTESSHMPIEDEGNDAVESKKQKVLSTKAKQIRFGRLPRNLVIHLNRSIFDDWGNQRKNTSFVDFASRLEVSDDWMTSFADKESSDTPLYELRCIVTHQGRHDNGHYVACGKRGKEWYSFNDEIVTRITEEQVLGRGHVFMLFYEEVEQKALLEFSTPEGSETSSSAASGRVHENERGKDAGHQPGVLPGASSMVQPPNLGKLGDGDPKEA